MMSPNTAPTTARRRRRTPSTATSTTLAFASLCLSLLVGGVEGFKFMKNIKAPTLISDEQRVAIAKTEERFGDKKLVIITGCSSGLGRATAKNLLSTNEYVVIGAVRDIDKAEAVSEIDNWKNLENFYPMQLELNSFASVDDFCQRVEEFRIGKPIDRLVCNAGAYQPSLPYAKWSADGHEQTMQINFLSHFLMVSKFLESMRDAPDPRVVMVGSVTGNDNTVGGGGVYPIADLKGLDGFKAGFQNPVAMADGYGFIGAKAYKDSKLCLMMTSNFLHAKYHRNTGIAFSSIYPGCIAETPLFREKRAWFRKYFPIFMKYITGGYVSLDEAGQRLYQIIHDPRCNKSGVYWSWNGGPREGRGAAALEQGGQISGGGGSGGGWDSVYENDQSDKVRDVELSVDLFQAATAITGAEWPKAKSFTSPCPTLQVIGAVSKNMIAREELKRMAERPGFDGSGNALKLTKRKRAALVADKVLVQGVLGNTVGRVGRLASRYILGRIPDTAIEGSFQEEKPLEESIPGATKLTPTTTTIAAPVLIEADATEITSMKAVEVDEETKAMLEAEIFDQVFANGKKAGDDDNGEKEWSVDANGSSEDSATAEEKTNLTLSV